MFYFYPKKADFRKWAFTSRSCSTFMKLSLARLSWDEHRLGTCAHYRFPIAETIRDLEGPSRSVATLVSRLCFPDTFETIPHKLPTIPPSDADVPRAFTWWSTSESVDALAPK